MAMNPVSRASIKLNVNQANRLDLSKLRRFHARLRNSGRPRVVSDKNLGIFAACDFAVFTEGAIRNDHRHPRRLRRDDMCVPDGLSDISRSQIDLLLAWLV